MTKQYVIHTVGFGLDQKSDPYPTLEEAKRAIVDKSPYPEPIEWFGWIDTSQDPADRKPVVCGAQTILGHQFILPFQIHEEEV